MKKLLLAGSSLLLLLLYGNSFAQMPGADAVEEKTVTFRFIAGDDMFYLNETGNGPMLDSLFNLVERYRTEITSGRMPVHVDGYSASLSSDRQNRYMAYLRASRVKSELILKKGLKEEYFVTRNYPGAFEGNNDIVMVTIRIPAEPRIVLVEEEPSREEAPFAFVEPRAEPNPEPAEPVISRPGHRGFYIRTNLLYDAMLAPTLGVEWRISDHGGIKVDGSFAHWGSSHGRVQKLWLISPEVRWYLCDARRLYVGAGVNIGQFNLYKGVARIISKDTGYQGDLYGGGAVVGYRLPLCRRLAMDFNLGLGVTHLGYDTFTVSNGVRVYKEKGVSKNIWGPTQAGVNLVWNLGK